MKKVVKIKPSDGKCSDCGKVKDLRPYGKDGAWVCFDCGMKDEEEAKRQFDKLTGDADIVILG